jgi:hypothetical protein
MVENSRDPDPQLVASCALEIKALILDLRLRYGVLELHAALADTLAEELRQELKRQALRPTEAWLVIDRARRVTFADSVEQSRSASGLAFRIRLCLRALGWMSHVVRKGSLY